MISRKNSTKNEATVENNTLKIRNALRAGASLNVPGPVSGDLLTDPALPMDMPAVHLAAHCGAIAALELLCDLGASLDDAFEHGATALWFAARNGQCDAFSLLWSRGASRNSHLMRKETLIHAAASSRACAIVESIHRDDPALFAESLEAQNFEGCTPLVCALINQREEVAFLLVRLGAHVNACRDHIDSSALRWALLMPRAEFLRMLLEHPQFDLDALLARQTPKIFWHAMCSMRLLSLA